MKNILVATDFSPASENALRYATKLATEFNATITLLHVYQRLPGLFAESATAGKMRTFIIDRLTIAAQITDSGYSPKMNIRCEEGPVAETVLTVAKEINADLLITGMKTNGKAFRKTFGSTIITLIKKIAIPMLVIPGNTSFQPVDVIALANERDIEMEENAGMLNVFRQLAQAFHSSVHIVRVAHSPGEAEDARIAPFRLTKLLGTLDPAYQCMIGNDVTDTLVEFIEHHKVKMLAMLPHEHTIVQRIFSSRNTRAMIFETKIPLLVLPLIKIGNENTRNTRQVKRKRVV